MHLLRGAGLAGLQGMPYRALPNAWSGEIPLVRPLLACWREQVESYLQERALQPVFDPSNLDTRYYRNRLRHELIPYLENYNPKVRQLLWRTAATLGDDYRLIESLVDEAWAACLVESGAGYLGFNAQALRGLPQSIQNHLYRRAIYHLREELRDVDYHAIRRVHRFLVDPPATMHVDLLAGLELVLEGELLWLHAGDVPLPDAEWPQIQRGKIYYLPVPGLLSLGNQWVLRAEPWVDVGEVPGQAAGNQDPYRAWINGGRLVTPLVVRSRLPGDRIQPLGMGGHSLKVADLMVNEKLPRRLRDCWPLVISAGEVVWLPGIRTVETCRVTDQSSNIVHLHLYKVEDRY
jgi:tRNA(Ile)-lysidine synthase